MSRAFKPTRKCDFVIIRTKNEYKPEIKKTTEHEIVPGGRLLHRRETRPLRYAFRLSCEYRSCASYYHTSSLYLQHLVIYHSSKPAVYSLLTTV